MLVPALGSLVPLLLGAPSEDPIPSIVADVRPARLRADVDRLVGFGTRHTASTTDSETEGIGAARRWLEAELRAISESTGGRLDVRTQRFEVDLGRVVGRPEERFELVNVYGVLPGRVGDPLGRTFVVAGHYDSIPGRWNDTQSAAPGADDDASGTAAVLEMARVLASHEFDANLVFLLVPGEEQGLYGSKHFAERADADGWRIEGMFTNDIVGGVEGFDGRIDRETIRVFAGGDEPEAGSKELARLIAECCESYVDGARVRMIHRLDRYGRGGDHIPFHEAGVAAVRFTEANEHYLRQHQNVGVLEGVRRGDDPEFVDEEYLARVTRVNAAALARLAAAPPPPERVRMRGAMTYAPRLSWSAVEGAVGYEVVWRETTSVSWEHALRTEEPGAQLEGVVADNFYWGVRAIGASGASSVATAANRR